MWTLAQDQGLLQGRTGRVLGAGIFGRGMECENCVSRLPQNIAIDGTRALRVSRYGVVANALIKCMTFLMGSRV